MTDSESPSALVNTRKRNNHLSPLELKNSVVVNIDLETLGQIVFSFIHLASLTFTLRKPCVS